MKLGWTTLLLSLATGALLSAQAETHLPAWQVAAGTKMAFEVAAVKPAPPAAFRWPGFFLDDSEAYAPTGGRFSAVLPLPQLVTFAYKLHPTDDQRRAMFSKLAAWFMTDLCEIQAKAPTENPSKDQMRLMMQALLVDRFQLVVHLEVTTGVVFALVQSMPGQLGPQLRRHADGPPCDQAPLREVFPPTCGPLGLQSRPPSLRAAARDFSMEQLASWLLDLGKLDRPLVDRTELTGRFDFAMEWVTSRRDGLIPNGQPQVADESESNFRQALLDQLGLKLQPTRAPIQTLIVDHVERPSGN